MLRRFVVAFGAMAAILSSAAVARAQYKNQSFALDAGGWLITKPTVLEDNQVLPIDRRPLRLANGYRLGGETNFKMDEDHWWFTARVNVGILQYSASSDSPTKEAEFDAAAKKSLGTIIGIQGQMGVRYFIFTDRFRPYLGFGLSYLRLLTFSEVAGSDCAVAGICDGTEPGSNQSNYLPHPNVGGVHFEPGAEIILTRDVFLHLFVDMQHWLVINAADNNAVVLGIGFTFYT